MKKYLILTICLLSVALLNAAENEIWDKARNIAELNWNLVPGLSSTVSETLNIPYEVSVNKTEYVVAHQPFENLIMNELVSAKIDGVEQTGENASREFDGILKHDLTPEKEGMFFRDNGEGLTYEFTGREEEVKGFNCLAFDFIYEIDHENNTYRGVVWLDRDTGAPIKREFSMDKNPRLVKDMSIEEYYHYDPQTREWFRESVKSQTIVAVMGQEMMNITTVTYSDYWRYEE
jgi:hypothetical protein